MSTRLSKLVSPQVLDKRLLALLLVRFSVVITRSRGFEPLTFAFGVKARPELRLPWPADPPPRRGRGNPWQRPSRSQPECRPSAAAQTASTERWPNRASDPAGSETCRAPKTVPARRPPPRWCREQ